MGSFDTLREKATDLAQAGVAQSKRLAEMAKLKLANMSEEDAIKKAYLELGRLYYAEHGATPEGAYAAACEKVTAAKAAIEANNDRIAELKSESGESAEEVPVEEAPAVEDAVVAETSAEEVPVKEAPAEEAPADGNEPPQSPEV